MAFSSLMKACAEKEVMSAHNSKVSKRQLFLFYCSSSFKQNRKCYKHLLQPIFLVIVIYAELFFCLCPMCKMSFTCLPYPLPMASGSFLFSLM